jgi:uncharacterized protein
MAIRTDPGPTWAERPVANPPRLPARVGEVRPSLSGRPHPARPGRQVGPAGRVLVLGLTCFLLWGLLAAPSLHRSAETSPLGMRRTVALAVLRPLTRMSAVFGLDRIESGVERVLGRHNGREAPPPLLRTTGVERMGPPASSQPRPVPSPPSPDLGVRPPAKSLSPPSVPAFSEPPVHRPSRAHPLRVLAVGDSIGEDLAIGLARALSGRKSFVLETDARQSTGLARPDYFDWAHQVAVDIRKFRPDVVVAMFGANDAQSFIARGRGVRMGTSEWKRIYRQRAGRIMAQVSASGRPLIWVGMPPMAAEWRSQSMRMINGLLRAEAARRPGVLYMDSWRLFAGSGGGYSAYLRNASGEQELVRTSDGVHLTAAGLDRLASAVMRTMATLWRRPAR